MDKPGTVKQLLSSIRVGATDVEQPNSDIGDSGAPRGPQMLILELILAITWHRILEANFGL